MNISEYTVWSMMKSSGSNTTSSTAWWNHQTGTGLGLHQISQLYLCCRTGVLACCRKMQFSFSLTLFLPVNLIPLGPWDLLLVGTCSMFDTPLPSLWLPKHNLPFPTHHCESHIPHSAHKDMSSPPSLCLGKPRRALRTAPPLSPRETCTWLDECYGYWNIFGAWDPATVCWPGHLQSPHCGDFNASPLPSANSKFKKLFTIKSRTVRCFFPANKKIFCNWTSKFKAWRVVLFLISQTMQC